MTQVGVRRLSDGKRLAKRVFRSWVDDNVGRFARPVDLDGGRMLIGGSGGRVMAWSWKRDVLRTVKDDKWHLQTGTLRRDVAAGFTAPGERCTFVARLSRPGRELWRSCTQRVLSFSPDGRRMVTIDRRITPGFGTVREIVMRTITGQAARPLVGPRLLRHRVGERHRRSASGSTGPRRPRWCGARRRGARTRPTRRVA